jgi:hypothetical protein
MMEVEYIAASEVSKEAIWIRKIIFKLGIVPSALSPLDLCCDNNGAITQAKDLGRTKSPNTYFGAITLFVRSLRKVM